MTECMFGSYYICSRHEAAAGPPRVSATANDDANVDIDHRIAAE